MTQHKKYRKPNARTIRKNVSAVALDSSPPGGRVVRVFIRKGVPFLEEVVINRIKRALGIEIDSRHYQG